MKQIKIGLPKAFLYYRYHTLWHTFFENLGCTIVESQDTTKKTIDIGKKYSIDESCLSSKIYLGHVASLQNKCDYILVPRIDNYGKSEKVCVKFNATYDIVKNLFKDNKILFYNIDKNKHSSEFTSFFKIGIKLTKRPLKTIRSYIKAKKVELKYQIQKEQEQRKKLNSNKTKILIVSHPYNIYDNYIGLPIIKKLEEMNIEVIYANVLNKKIARKYGNKLSPTLYWIYSKELIGGLEFYRKWVNGIIFLTAFPCGPDSLVNELMIRKITDIPITNILIDDLSANTGLETRLESFIDIIEERKEYHD